MGLILLRYGEIALKGQNRTYFFRKLRRNVRLCLKANQISGEVWQDGQRIYLETEQVPAAVEAVKRVFGIVSLSPVEVVTADLQAMSREAVSLAQRAGLQAGRPFRVRARRSDKSFPHISPEIERQIGAAVVEATQAAVDLSGDDALEIGVEVQPSRALIFGETLPGPGGLPLSSQGKVVALLSSGIDSPVAAWLLMKRGSGVVPVHFSTSEAQSEQVEAIVGALNQWAYGWQLKPLVLSHEQILGPTLTKLRQLRAERWTCLFCKRAMVARAAEIAEEMGASAVVTGDSLGQVASQTLSNLEVISYGIQKPLLRPLIGLDKTEIMKLARHIGTYELSTREAHACPFLPDRPLTQGSIAKLRALLEEVEGINDPDCGPSSAQSQWPGGEVAAEHV
jgi:thiamine biosynthesis protein ThiI